MQTTITAKGQITIPAKLRRKFHLRPGDVLQFDENASFLKAMPAFDIKTMRAVIGCSRNVGPDMSPEKWLAETRGPVDLPKKR